MSEKITTAPKSTLYRLLKKEGYLPNGITSATRTGPRFRRLFGGAGTKEPQGNPATEILTWPSVDEWVNSLSMKQASAVLSEIIGNDLDR